MKLISHLCGLAVGVEDDDGVAGGGLGPGEARPDQAELPRLDVQLDVRRETVLDVERQRVRYIWSGKYTASQALKCFSSSRPCKHIHF